jgi:hypothetical protein
MTNLQPTQGQKSFYNKAKIHNNSEGKILLTSYNTHVATFDTIHNKMYVYGYFSQTTAKHINSFLELYGFKRCNKKQLENYNN